MGSYSSVIGHQSMVFDDVRNSAYGASMDRLLNPHSVVLDLGSGLGIHGLMAAAKGSRHVYLVDPSPVTAVAAKVVAENGLANKVTCIQKKIEDAELPERVDIIVSVFTGNFLLEEDLLPSLFYARDKHLKPSGVLLPDQAEMRVVPVNAAEYHQKHICQWAKSAQGISFASVREYAANSLYYDRAKDREAQFLADPASIASLDFNSAIEAACANEHEFIIKQKGECHGFLGWFRMRLGDEWQSSSPKKPAMHWSQVFLPLDPPVVVKIGDRLSLKLQRPQFGDWTWICSHAGKTQRRSTFLSRAIAIDDLRRLAKDNPLALNTKGELARFVISLMDGVNTVEMIRHLALKEFGNKFTTGEELNRQVQSIFANYGR